MTEDVSEVLFALLGETFNIEVASLLRRFVLQSLVLEFLFALRFLEGFFYIEFRSLVIHAVELLDGLGGATRSIFNVVFVWGAEADEVEFLVGIFRALTSV